MARPIIAVVALSALLLAPLARGADDSTPKGAAEAFFKALEAGDAAKAKSLASGDPKQMELLDNLVPLVGNFKKMEQAAVKKFGDEGKKLLSNGGSASFDIESQMKDAKVEETGDTATITPAKKEKEEGKNSDPMKLKKVSGKWKIDMAAMPNAEQMDNPQAKKMFGAMSDAAKAMTVDIEAGKFKTVADAQQGFQQKMLAAMMSAAGEGGLGQPGGAAQPPKDK
jgi:hypothetical protein